MSKIIGITVGTPLNPDKFGGGGSTGYFDYAKCGLPVLALTGDISAMTKENAVQLEYKLSTRRVATPPLYKGTCECKWQGSSSVRRGYPKRNYTIKFDTEFEATSIISSTDGVTKPTPWGSQKKYCMKANWIDPSAARNVVNAKMWGQVVASRESVHEKLAASPNYGAVDGFPIVILINGEFEGLYTFNIPKEDWLFNMGEGDAEYIVCGESNSMAACGFKAEATFIEGDSQANTDFAFEYQPEGVEDATVVTSFNNAIRAVMNAPNSAEWESAVAPYFDVQSAIDYYIFVCCIAGEDNLQKNILYATYDGIKWFMSAYDLDTTMGSNPYGTAVYEVKAPNTQSFEKASERHRLFALIYKYSKDKLKARYKELRNTVLSDENVWYMYNNFVCPISRAVYNADAQKWADKRDTDDRLPMPATTTANVENYMQYYQMHCALLDKEMALNEDDPIVPDEPDVPDEPITIDDYPIKDTLKGLYDLGGDNSLVNHANTAIVPTVTGTVDFTDSRFAKFSGGGNASRIDTGIEVDINNNPITYVALCSVPSGMRPIIGNRRNNSPSAVGLELQNGIIEYCVNKTTTASGTVDKDAINTDSFIVLAMTASTTSYALYRYTGGVLNVLKDSDETAVDGWTYPFASNAIKIGGNGTSYVRPDAHISIAAIHEGVVTDEQLTEICAFVKTYGEQKGLTIE